MTAPVHMNGPFPLGSRARDKATKIDGQLVAYTHWHDRSDEACILRDGVNNDGSPWELHWFPASRLLPA